MSELLLAHGESVLSGRYRTQWAIVPHMARLLRGLLGDPNFEQLIEKRAIVHDRFT